MTAHECSLIAYHVFAKSTLGERQGSIEQSEFDKVAETLKDTGWRINWEQTSEVVYDAQKAVEEPRAEFFRYVDEVWGDLQDCVLQRHNSAAKPGSTWIHATRGDFPRLLEMAEDLPYDQNVADIVKAIKYIQSGLHKFEPISTVVEELEGIINGLRRELANGVENDMHDVESLLRDISNYTNEIIMIDPLRIMTRIRTLLEKAEQEVLNVAQRQS